MPPIVFSDSDSSDSSYNTVRENLEYPDPDDDRDISLLENNNASQDELLSRDKYSRDLQASSEAMPTSSSEIDTDQDQHTSDGLEGEPLGLEPELDGLNEIAERFAVPQRYRALESVYAGDLIYPKSRYEGYELPLPISKERIAVKALLQEAARLEAADLPVSYGEPHDQAVNVTQESFTEFELTDFTIYMPGNSVRSPFELRPLQHLANKLAHSSFLFDGILSVGNVRHYLQAVPFKVCSIGNYGEDIHEVGDHIWIQSNSNESSDLFYRLRAPASEYARYHDTFLWCAELAKHFVDYCQASEDAVSVNNFRADFSRWMQKTHGGSANFQSWYQKYQHDDFRRAISANITFLFKESIGVNEELRSLPIWRELMEQDAIPQQPIQETKTVVTPYVFKCFKDLKFNHHLKVVTPTNDARARRASQGRSLNLTTEYGARYPRVEIPMPGTAKNSIGTSAPGRSINVEKHAADALAEHKRMILALVAGDVVSVTKDGEGSSWKDEESRWKAADHCWYVYVQRVHDSPSGKRSFDGIWLYKASDTCCAKMRYPFLNELFLSDNCTCLTRRIAEDEVLDVVKVVWHGHPSGLLRDIFIRQTYLENERFVTLNDSHKTCKHLTDQGKIRHRRAKKYRVGQTVLAPPPTSRKSKHGLEPYEIVAYSQRDTREFATLRRLLRRSDIEAQSTCRPNELVYTEQTDKVLVSTIGRTCLVRFYSDADLASRAIPAPYSRDGTGNAFYITRRLVENDGSPELEAIENEGIPSNLIQGFDPSAKLGRKLLQGLDLYCGGGNFGRGLEEGGAMRNKWAVDLERNAIHTYFANLNDSAETKLFFGSVDDLLTQALAGNPRESELIPQPGDVDFISAGSPCQGFSALNAEKNNEKGLKNQSLVASVAAYVDFFRPKYGLLENVMSMARKGRGRDEDVLSQLICALVGMGYQLQLFVLDAWSCGSPQSRTRLFVSFAAPGLEPLEHPELSHSHPPGVAVRGLGLLANGQSFGQRVHAPTPFEFVTAREATRDLPEIGDGHTSHCIRHPDHVMSLGVSQELKMQISTIPTHPRGMNFARLWRSGSMREDERALFPNITKSGGVRQAVTATSKAWGRVNPEGLFPIVVVCTSAADARMGTCLHWDQHRYITVMETRRAQSFPDEEVLVGDPSKQRKVVGNSVARTCALALGLSLREAWLRNTRDDEDNAVAIRVSDALPATLYYSNGQPSHRHICKSSKARSNRVVRDLVDSSDEAGLSEMNFRRSLESLALRSSCSPDGVASSMSSTDSDRNKDTKSLKRRHSTVQEMRSLPGGRHKARRLSSHMSHTSSRAADSPLTTPKNGNNISLKGSANNSLNPLVVARESLSISPPPFNSVAMLRRFEPRKITTPAGGKSERPSRAIPKAQPVFNLISDDEDIDDAADELSNHRVILPPPKNYFPVNNNKSTPHGQMNRIQGRIGDCPS